MVTQDDPFFIESAQRTIALESQTVSELGLSIGSDFAEACRA